MRLISNVRLKEASSEIHSLGRIRFPPYRGLYLFIIRKMENSPYLSLQKAVVWNVGNLRVLKWIEVVFACAYRIPSFFLECFSVWINFPQVLTLFIFSGFKYRTLTVLSSYAIFHGVIDGLFFQKYIYSCLEKLVQNWTDLKYSFYKHRYYGEPLLILGPLKDPVVLGLFKITFFVIKIIQ